VNKLQICIIFISETLVVSYDLIAKVWL